MQKQNVQTLKGFRDFLPAEKRARDYVQDRLKVIFGRFGFEPLETPTLEYAELLLGKYGAEADKLVYTFQDRGGREVGLRYDQTVPTARVLTQYQGELSKGFRRYQIQNVFRADKPQRGRYREFTQCDADIFGSRDTLADAEILTVFYNLYQSLGIKGLTIAVNDRETLIKTLTPFATDQVTVATIIQSIDKLDKQTVAEVTTELIAKGMQAGQAGKALSAITSATPSSNLQSIIAQATSLGLPEEALVFTPTLARGLDYYTGLIFESKVEGVSGSLGGGGRYDNLVESLGGPATPAVGFGLGFDRTVEIAQEQGLLPTQSTTALILVTIFPNSPQGQTLRVAQSLREAGINTELYPDSEDKLVNQLKYGGKKGIPYAVIIGEEEVAKNLVTLKNLESREQQTLPLDEIIGLLSNRR